jgi:hypothetical protein
MQLTLLVTGNLVEINKKKYDITNIIRDDIGMSNGQVIMLSNFPFDCDTTIVFNKYLKGHFLTKW